MKVGGTHAGPKHLPEREKKGKNLFTTEPPEKTGAAGERRRTEQGERLWSTKGESKIKRNVTRVWDMKPFIVRGIVHGSTNDDERGKGSWGCKC